MSYYSPIENSRRIKEGLVSLIAGRAAEFGDDRATFIVVFDGEPTRSAAGRIHLFQQFILDHLGIVPEVIRQIPACVKVFFGVGDDENDLSAIAALLATDDFRHLCDDLNVSQVQFGSSMHYIRAATR